MQPSASQITVQLLLMLKSPTDIQGKGSLLRRCLAFACSGIYGDPFVLADSSPLVRPATPPLKEDDYFTKTQDYVDSLNNALSWCNRDEEQQKTDSAREQLAEAAAIFSKSNNSLTNQFVATVCGYDSRLKDTTHTSLKSDKASQNIKPNAEIRKKAYKAALELELNNTLAKYFDFLHRSAQLAYSKATIETEEQTIKRLQSYAQAFEQKLGSFKHVIATLDARRKQLAQINDWVKELQERPRQRAEQAARVKVVSEQNESGDRAIDPRGDVALDVPLLVESESSKRHKVNLSLFREYLSELKVEKGKFVNRYNWLHGERHSNKIQFCELMIEKLSKIEAQDELTIRGHYNRAFTETANQMLPKSSKSFDQKIESLGILSGGKWVGTSRLLSILRLVNIDRAWSSPTGERGVACFKGFFSGLRDTQMTEKHEGLSEQDFNDAKDRILPPKG
jgi:hypothetical protein